MMLGSELTRATGRRRSSRNSSWICCAIWLPRVPPAVLSSAMQISSACRRVDGSGSRLKGYSHPG
jgi:hypothetical protein